MIEALIEEIKGEYFISPFFSTITIENYILEAMDDIKKNVSSNIDFTTDLKARALVKNYVKYAIENLKDEFKVRYASEYLELQINYTS